MTGEPVEPGVRSENTPPARLAQQAGGPRYEGVLPVSGYPALGGAGDAPSDWVSSAKGGYSSTSEAR
jgi:hypothetical protein